MTYKELIIEILQQAKEPLTSRQIWARACELGLDKKLSKLGKTPVTTIGATISIVTRIGEKENQFIFASKRPTTFWLKERENELLNIMNLKITNGVTNKN
ncbi:MAG: HrgA protein, partial [Helicobacter sp.]|nr:HrgA protein [Helicobacter sp.]